MDWHALGDHGEPYPVALRRAVGRSGVYAIRSHGLILRTVLYVGESHTGNLYKTLTRHFQQWNRDKKWWRGQYSAEQTDPGHTFDRSLCDVAFEVCTKTEAGAMQTDWIARLRPVHNSPMVEEEVPF